MSFPVEALIKKFEFRGFGTGMSGFGFNNVFKRRGEENGFLKFAVPLFKAENRYQDFIAISATFLYFFQLLAEKSECNSSQFPQFLTLKFKADNSGNNLGITGKIAGEKLSVLLPDDISVLTREIEEAMGAAYDEMIDSVCSFQKVFIRENLILVAATGRTFPYSWNIRAIPENGTKQYLLESRGIRDVIDQIAALAGIAALSGFAKNGVQ
jgi:hypothetical protein